MPYTLYSVWDDGTDNGGKPIESPNWSLNYPSEHYQTDQGYKGDFVAGLHTHHFETYFYKGKYPSSKISEAKARAAILAMPPLGTYVPSPSGGE